MKMNKNPLHRDAIRTLMKKVGHTGSTLNIDPPGRLISATDQSIDDQISLILKSISNVTSSDEFRIQYFENFSSAYL